MEMQKRGKFPLTVGSSFSKDVGYSRILVTFYRVFFTGKGKKGKKIPQLKECLKQFQWELKICQTGNFCGVNIS